MKDIRFAIAHCAFAVALALLWAHVAGAQVTAKRIDEQANAVADDDAAS